MNVKPAVTVTRERDIATTSNVTVSHITVPDGAMLRKQLQACIAGEGERRYLTHSSLQTIAKAMASDKTLAEISSETEIPIEISEGQGAPQRVLRNEITRFGTWLGQRDATLKQTPSSNFTIPEDLTGCLNAKRNIVVSYDDNKLRPEVLADFLSQRYASGDITMTRAAFAVTVAGMASRATGVEWFQAHLDSVKAGESGQPAVLMLKILDLAETVREDLATAALKLREALGAADSGKLNDALNLTSWVNLGLVHRMLTLQRRITIERDRASAVTLIHEAKLFLAQIERLAEGDELDFLRKLAKPEGGGASLVTALLDQYMPQGTQRRELEGEARGWLKRRGMGRQANMLLSHVMWALKEGELDLLKVALDARGQGMPDWEKEILEAQLASK